MPAYYNEIDPFAAAWLRELIKAGKIAPGVVDTRSIEDVDQRDLAGFDQCHFFAGIGVWSYALRQAGWPDDRPVWTGSCPCQPFSSSGKQRGFEDERHLWPEFYRLISQCRPAVCFGEQVASKPGLAWIDLVQTNLEKSGYAFGAVDICAAGVGAPHIRQRLYWVADTNDKRPQGRYGVCQCTPKCPAGESCVVGGLAHAESAECKRPWPAWSGRQGLADYMPACGLDNAKCNGRGARRDNDRGHDGQQFNADRNACGLAYAKCEQKYKEQQRPSENEARWCADEPCGCSVVDASQYPGPVNGYWRDADWLFCRDGKWRAVEPGTFPLAHGAAARVGRLRGYGNAINAEQAKAFIMAYNSLNYL